MKHSLFYTAVSGARLLALPEDEVKRSSGVERLGTLIDHFSSVVPVAALHDSITCPLGHADDNEAVIAEWRH